MTGPIYIKIYEDAFQFDPAMGFRVEPMENTLEVMGRRYDFDDNWEYMRKVIATLMELMK